MVTALGAPAVEIAEGVSVVLDGTRGSLVVHPSAARARTAALEMSARLLPEERSRAERDLPAVTRDGRRVTVLTNVASLGELQVGLRSGAEGIGLLRTELAFLDATRWPTEQEHSCALEPILGALGGRRGVVRVLDFGADKSPPFLRGTGQRGLELLLSNGGDFVSQLRAILLCSQGRDVRILLPLVATAAQLTATRGLLQHTAGTLGIDLIPPLGAMIETPAAAADAVAIARKADFLSIGTNDLTATTLGTDRFASSMASAHDPRVLRLIERSVSAAHDAGITIEVCGEAASDPLMVPLLVGLGVDELSVGAARVGSVRRWIRNLSLEHVGRLARSVLALRTVEEVTDAASALASELEADSAHSVNGGRERLQRGGRVHALGA
jgi:phosphoenolpyruvate-protein kinase (PTS system EI component)